MILNGKTAIITGGSRGLGEQIAYKLASMGANIAIVDVGDPALAESVCRNCETEYGVKALSYRCDVSNFSQVKDTVANIKKDFGTAHVLVNNAGITRDNIAAMMSEEDFDKVIAVNLKGAFNMIRHTSGLFIRNREGCIINISSVSGVLGNAGQANYCAAKAGVIGLTKCMARELASRGITVNAVAPGFIRTDMTDVLKDNVKEAIIATIPMKTFGETEDVANTVAFLASDAARYITGQVISVDGGMAM